MYLLEKYELTGLINKDKRKYCSKPLYKYYWKIILDKTNCYHTGSNYLISTDITTLSKELNEGFGKYANKNLIRDSKAKGNYPIYTKWVIEKVKTIVISQMTNTYST